MTKNDYYNLRGRLRNAEEELVIATFYAKNEENKRDINEALKLIKKVYYRIDEEQDEKAKLMSLLKYDNYQIT